MTDGDVAAMRAVLAGAGQAGDEEIVAWGEPESTLRGVLERLADGAELVTCIAGDGAPLPDDRIAQLVPDGIELETRAGGQPSWWWLLTAE